MSKRSLGAFVSAGTFFLAALGVWATAHAQTSNPYSPAYGHPYRHGAIPTYDTWRQMQEWQVAQPTPQGLIPTNILSYLGGIDGIGVTSGIPRVYLVFYGSQWGTQGNDGLGNITLTNDPVGSASYLQKLFKGVGTGGELWSGTVTQYCDGPLVTVGATSCPPGANHVGYPTSGAFAGVWYDNAGPSPQAATAVQLAQEAINAAAHFGNVTPQSNRYAQYIIVSPTGTNPDGFNTVNANFCAWHNYNGGIGVVSAYGDIAFSNLPYVHDLAGCGTDIVNGNTPQGHLDGFSLAAAHEYAETVTDQNPGGGWYNLYGGEIADECVWGARQNVILGGNSFAMPALWSNDTDECEIAHVLGAGVAPAATQVAIGSARRGAGEVPVPMYFRLTRTGDTSYPAILNYRTQNGTAAAGFDYLPVSGSLTIPAASASAVVPVTILPGTYHGPDRSLQLVVDSAVGLGPVPAFAAAHPLTAGQGPVAVVSVDLNGDGKADIAAVNLDGSVSVFRNTTAPGAATPSYATQQTFPVDASSFAIAVGDINGDGKPDLITANNVGSVSVLIDTTPPGAGTFTFAATILPLAPSADAVAIADVNGDGKPDLIVATGNDAHVLVLINTTSPGASVATVAAPLAFALSGASFALTVADMNGDGKVDIIAANFTNSQVDVLRNTTDNATGTATFAPAQPFGAGYGPFGVIATDLNGDGRPDLAVANAVGSSVSLLLNTTANGAPSFSFLDSGALPAYGPYGLAAGDINGDGKPDLMVATAGETGDTTSITVFTNATAPGSTSAVFSQAYPFTTDPGPTAVALADVNGDGKADIVTANLGVFNGTTSDGTTLSILLNTSPPGLTIASPGTPEPFQSGDNGNSTPYAVAIGDMDRDGRADLVTANYFDGSVAVLLNNMSPGALAPAFSPRQVFSVGTHPASVALADLDGDGLLDVVAANNGSGNVSVLHNVTSPGSATLIFDPQQTFATDTGTIGAVIADLNGDGKPDLVVSNNGAANVAVLLNTTPPGGTIAFAAKQLFGSGVTGPPAVIDVNGDGKPDIVYPVGGTNQIAVLRNTAAPGAPTATFAAPQTFGTGANPTDVAAADVNGDGVPDLAVVNFADGTVSVLLNTTAPGASTFTFAAQQPFTVNATPFRLVMADVNGDGRPDITVVNGSTVAAASILLNTTAPGAAVPAFAPQQQFNSGYSALGLAIADLNGDGQPDMAVANLYAFPNNTAQPPSTVSVLLNRRYAVQLAGNPATGTITFDYIFGATFE